MEKPVEGVGVTKIWIMRLLIILPLLFFISTGFAQEENADQSGTYKKRVLENTEIDLLFNYYNQDGENAAVTGGRGTEELSDIRNPAQAALVGQEPALDGDPGGGGVLDVDPNPLH